jgi:putative two-component system response regulator
MPRSGNTAPLAQASLAPLDRAELRKVLAPQLEVLQEELPRAKALAQIEAALATGRNLYALGRSDEAVPLARSVLSQARRIGDPALVWRALTACGILSADAFDIVGGLEFHLQALKVSTDERDALEQGRTWNNIGLVMALAGSPGMAVRAYVRSFEAVEPVAGPVFIRYSGCSNRANSLFHLGRYDEGLDMALRALAQLTPEFAQQDPLCVILLRRNLVNLLVATGQAQKAAGHVDELTELARQSNTLRADIVCSTARAVYELSTGRRDVAFTRFEQALAKAREHPPALRDTLVCMIRAEEMSGSPERALARLQELSEHVHRFAIERALRHVELAGLEEGLSASERMHQQTRARLASRVERPQAPSGWEALRRLSVSAALRFDPTGWHGVRVRALTQALALDCGEPPLRALEIGLAAELHDIGMLSVPEEILTKRTPLSLAEQAAYWRHTSAGADMLRDDQHPRVLLAQEVATYHHAHWDGSGHPSRIAGRHIPLAARMCAVVDAYDERVCGLGARKAMGMGDALKSLSHAAGTDLDPDLVRRFDSVVRAETSSYGIDPEASPGLEDFQELVALLQEDRGFL